MSARFDHDRRRLPYRDKAEAFLVTAGGLILSQDRQRFLMFPGGGIDSGEEPAQALVREVREETGYAIADVTFLGTVAWDWFPEWANTPTRRERYEEFRGERVHIFGGIIEGKQLPSPTEQDAWNGRALMPIERCLELADKYAAADHPNTYAYRVAQQMAIRAIQWLHLRRSRDEVG